MGLYGLFLRCIGANYPPVTAGANYFAEKRGKTLYIFFEGSNGGDDWRANLDFPARAYKREGERDFYAHRGFLESWKSTAGSLEKYISDKSVTGAVVVGYSHGAAMAVLCHEYIWCLRPDLRQSLTGYGFACPRVLWGRAGRDVKRRWENFTVIRNLDDAVTHLPPAFFGYFHVGELLEIGTKGKYGKFEAHAPESIAAELSLYEYQRYMESNSKRG